METLTLATPIDQLLFSTTRVEADLPGGIAMGTAFFMAFRPTPDRPDQFFPVLITNRHVVEGASAGRFLVHGAEMTEGGARQPSGRRFYSEMTDFGRAWVYHPDPGVDLAGAPLGRAIRHLEAAGYPAYLMQIGEELIPSGEELGSMSVMEDVVMVGYPQGIADEAHGFPLYRHGFTASHPSIDFDDKPWGALDIAIFGGSSGSPVLTYRPECDAQAGPWLLGVLWGGPQAAAEGMTIEPLPTTRQSVSTPIYMNIGYYVKAQELIVLREAMLSALKIGGRG